SEEIRRLQRRRHPSRQASTEPRSEERGDWECDPDDPDDTAASTEPRSEERGDSEAYWLAASDVKASTEPRSEERGDAVVLVALRLYRLLQRSLAPKSEEIGWRAP